MWSTHSAGKRLGHPRPAFSFFTCSSFRKATMSFWGNHIWISLHHHIVHPISSNHLNSRNWLVPASPLFPHVPCRGSRWEELDARVPHHLKLELQSLFEIVIEDLVGLTSYSLQVGMFSSWAQSIAAIPITSLHPDIMAQVLDFVTSKKRTIDISCKLLERWCKVYAVTTPGKCT